MQQRSLSLHVGANKGIIAKEKTLLIPLPNIRIAHQGACNKASGASQRKDIEQKSAEIFVPSKKVEPANQEKLWASAKTTVSRQKTCTDSPPAKKSRTRCPVVSKTRIWSTSRLHPSQGCASPPSRHPPEKAIG